LVLPPDQPDEPARVPERWYQRSAFRSWWKATAALLGTGLGGGMTWRATFISIGIGTLAASSDIFLGGEVPTRAAP